MKFIYKLDWYRVVDEYFKRIGPLNFSYFNTGQNTFKLMFLIMSITVKTQQQVLALDKENKQMKQTLTYLQQELIKSGKKNITKGAEKEPNQGISWHAAAPDDIYASKKANIEAYKSSQKPGRKKKH